MLIHDILTFAATKRPHRPALIIGDTERSFSELEARSDRLASDLAGRFPVGERVAVVGLACPGWVDVLYGVPRAGLVLVPLNDRLTPAEQLDQLRTAEVSVLIGTESALEALRPHLGEVPSIREVLTMDTDDWHQRIEGGGIYVRHPDPDPGDPAWMIFTSGTTGRPKGAVLTHRSLITSVMSNSLGRPLGPDDVYISAYPLYHVSAVNLLISHFHTCPTVLLSRFHPAEFAAAARRHGATTTTMAPTMLTGLLDHLDQTDTALPRLRRIGYGAAPIPAALLRRAEQRLDVQFSESYGMTEMSGAVVFDRRPSPLVSLRVVDGEMADVPVGDVGEIVLRGDQTMVGYFRDEPASSAAFHGGWFHTGDLGTISPDGAVVVVGRIKDVIITGGENVMALEIEDVLHNHPDIAAAAVIGVPDEKWGEAICAFVEPAPGRRLSADQVVDHVTHHLARFKRPREVRFVETLPVNGSGKVDKAALRALISSTVVR